MKDLRFRRLTSSSIGLDGSVGFKELCQFFEKVLRKVLDMALKLKGTVISSSSSRRRSSGNGSNGSSGSNGSRGSCGSSGGSGGSGSSGSSGSRWW